MRIQAAWSDFTRDLKASTDNLQDCRYAAFDFKFKVMRQGVESESKIDKVVFLQLCPDASPVKRKMLYASSASAIKSALGSDRMVAFQVTPAFNIAFVDADWLSLLTDFCYSSLFCFGIRALCSLTWFRFRTSLNLIIRNCCSSCDRKCEFRRRL